VISDVPQSAPVKSRLTLIGDAVAVPASPRAPNKKTDPKNEVKRDCTFITIFPFPEDNLR
jgi:hypothetical protein